jgi:integrase
MAYKRKGVWYADIRPRVGGKPLLDSKGRPVRIRKRLPHVKYAPEAEKDERKMAAQLLYGEKEEVMVPAFEDFVNDTYLPWARDNKQWPDHDEFRCEVLCASPHFRGRKMDEFSVIQFEQFKKDRKQVETRYKRPRAVATINAELNIARSIFRRALVTGIIKVSPMGDVKNFDPPPFRTRRLKHDEERRIFKELHSYSYLEDVSLLALNTGMRAGEIARISVEDADFTRDLLFLNDAKWKQDKRITEGIPLNPTARGVLWRLCQQRKKGRLFFNEKSDPLITSNISSLFRAACQRAKVYGFRFHDLRHEFGSRLGDKGYEAFDIAKLMGHADVKMSMIYVHPKESRLRKAVSEIDSRTFGHSEDTKEATRLKRIAPKALKAQTM